MAVFWRMEPRAFVVCDWLPSWCLHLHLFVCLFFCLLAMIEIWLSVCGVFAWPTPLGTFDAASNVDNDDDPIFVFGVASWNSFLNKAVVSSSSRSAVMRAMLSTHDRDAITTGISLDGRLLTAATMVIASIGITAVQLCVVAVTGPASSGGTTSLMNWNESLSTIPPWFELLAKLVVLFVELPDEAFPHFDALRY